MKRWITVRERSWQARSWKLLMGPAQIVDGVCATFTFGHLHTGIALAVSRNLTRARIAHMKRGN